MEKSGTAGSSVLITGGTSGLGLELVQLFLKRGCTVISTGTRNNHPLGESSTLKYYRIDFASLEKTAKAAEVIRNNFNPCIIVNNAGILSPPDFLPTTDGLEYTFQVNFLAHLLLNEIILIKNPSGHPIRIASITSMAYRIGDKSLRIIKEEDEYKPFKAYSDSKLFMALLCRHLNERYPDNCYRFIGFDPGVFSSGIFRMQQKWFRMAYRIAAPVMRSPARVAECLMEIIERDDLVSGSIYDCWKQIIPVPVPDQSAEKNFWEQCHRLIEPYLK